MSNTPENSSRKDNRGKRRKLFFGEEQKSAAESRILNDERARRLERASSSKSVLEINNSVVEEGSWFYKNAAEACATQCPEAGDVTPKNSLRKRTPVKNSVPKVGKGFGNGERDWSTEELENLLSILEIDGFDGDFANLAAKLPNQSVDSVRYLFTEHEENREKSDVEIILDTKIEELREIKGVDFYANLPLYFQQQSLHDIRPAPSLVGGIDYAAIYAYIAAVMRGEVPKKLNPVTMAKFSQVFYLLKQRILAQPEVSFPEFKQKAGAALERKTELKERRSEIWSADELAAKETLLSGDVASIEEFYLSHASLNPF